MKAYKATYNQKCQDLKYEVGKTYTFNGELKICERGFHFCKNAIDTLIYYPYDKRFILLEIEVLGEVIDDLTKSVTDQFKVLRIVPFEEVKELFKEILTFDKNNNRIKEEDSNGYWEKFEYDQNNNLIKRKYSDGGWKKYEYDQNNNLIKEENSNGYWIKSEYDQNNNLIKQENSTGYWEKCEYDQNNNLIKQEDSTGYWIKSEYDKNLIHYEDSNNSKYSIIIN